MLPTQCGPCEVFCIAGKLLYFIKIYVRFIMSKTDAGVYALSVRFLLVYGCETSRSVLIF